MHWRARWTRAGVPSLTEAVAIDKDRPTLRQQVKPITSSCSCTQLVTFPGYPQLETIHAELWYRRRRA